MLPHCEKPSAKLPPIARTRALASILGFPEARLLYLADNTSSLWKPGQRIPKSDGTFRLTVDATPELKLAHERIKNRILKQVYYPPYMLGGICSTGDLVRDYKAHAARHSGCRILISEDIADFFPSTTTDRVRGIWQYFFCFSPEVASVLAKLTTLDGALPQGWKSSSYLANLALGEAEVNLFLELRRRGFHYSRFMDDITVSSNFKVGSRTKHDVVSLIYGTLNQCGYRQKRSKHVVAASGSRMQVTGLNVNARSPTLPKKERKAIRAQVHKCELWPKEKRSSAEYKKFWNSVSGKVGKLRRFHSKTASALRERLNQVKPG